MKNNFIYEARYFLIFSFFIFLFIFYEAKSSASENKRFIVITIFNSDDYQFVNNFISKGWTLTNCSTVHNDKYNYDRCFLVRH